jgi:hypothetical protein
MRFDLETGMKKIPLLLWLSASTIFATEFRSPLSSGRGPFRAIMPKGGEAKKARAWWSSVYSRYADSSFSDEHGTAVEPLAANLFNKADFRLTEIFPESLIKTTAEYYNPLLRTTKLHLRANYSESGLVFGGHWDHRFASDKGRVGIRASLPVRKLRMEKVDVEGVRDGAQLQDVLSIQPIVTDKEGVHNSILVRLDFAEALVQTGNRNSAITYGDAGSTFGIGGVAVSDAANKKAFVDASDVNSVIDNPTSKVTGILAAANAAANSSGETPTSGDNAVFVRLKLTTDNNTDVHQFRVARDEAGSDGSYLDSTKNGLVDAGGIGANSDGRIAKRLENNPVAVYSKEGIIPREPDQFVALPSSTMFDGLGTFPKTGGISGKKAYYFDSATDYSGLPDEVTGTIDARLKNQNNKANTWLIPVAIQNHDLSYRSVPAASSGGVLKILKDLSEQVTENSYEWMHDRGLDFTTFEDHGLGDADVEVYYEHNFGNNILAEVNFGVKLPTAKKFAPFTSKEIEDAKNPYYMALGNGGHVEIRGGGMVFYKPKNWIGFRGSANYSMVLEADEERRACFKNAQIKNLGPRADATVDWGYFVARGDINISHPKSDKLTGVLGYEFYYKREESVRYKDKKLESWLGKEYDGTDFVEKLYALSDTQASNHTQAIAHRARWEMSYVHTEWLELYAGGSWSFAGKNMPREFDTHFGFHVLL